MKIRYLLYTLILLTFYGCAESIDSQRTIDELNYQVTDLQRTTEKAELRLSELEKTNLKLEEQNDNLMLLKKKMELNAEYIEELRNSAFEIKPPDDLKIIKLSPNKVTEETAGGKSKRIKKFSSVPKKIETSAEAEEESVDNDVMEEAESAPTPGVVVLKDKSDNIKHASAEDLTGGVEELYQKGLDANFAGEYEKSREIFNMLLVQFPTHNLADNALYWSGETYFSAKEYKKAIKKFTEVVKRYPRANKTPDALLKAGFSFLELEKPENAKKILEKVISLYPNSEAAATAQKKLGEL